MRRNVLRCLRTLRDPRWQMRLMPLLAVGLFTACGGDPVSPEVPQTLNDIERIEDLQAAFDGDAGVPRLVVLLSPT